MKKKIKVLNLYAGIGGNRKLWKDDEVEVTAVENVPQIAEIYHYFFPGDKVIVCDAHEYLLRHYKEFDFIWSSRPCTSHSLMRKNVAVNRGQAKPIYPDMKLYEEIIFLQHHAECPYVVENVKSYYEPLIKPQEVGRHYFWANFMIPGIKVPSAGIEFSKIKELEKRTGFDLSKVKGLGKRKDTILHNCVNPKLGLHVLNCAFKTTQEVLDI